MCSAELLTHLSLLAVRAEWEKEKALMLCQSCSAADRTPVCYQQCFSHKSKTLHPSSASEETPLCPSQTQSGSTGGEAGEKNQEPRVRPPADTLVNCKGHCQKNGCIVSEF